MGTVLGRNLNVNGKRILKTNKEVEEKLEGKINTRFINKDKTSKRSWSYNQKKIDPIGKQNKPWILQWKRKREKPQKR